MPLGTVNQSANHDSVMDEACQILSSNLSDRFQLHTVASQLNMSLSAFRQTFAAVVGVSPGEYRIRRRIEEAMTLLGQSDYTINEIASLLGYSSPYAFSAQFKKYTKHSPRTFRSRSR